MIAFRPPGREDRKVQKGFLREPSCLSALVANILAGSTRQVLPYEIGEYRRQML